VLVFKKTFSGSVFLNFKVFHVNDSVNIKGGLDGVVDLNDCGFERVVCVYHFYDADRLDEGGDVVEDNDSRFLEQDSQECDFFSNGGIELVIFEI
jgi:hypothetical protein